MQTLYIDVDSEEMRSYPQIAEQLKRGETFLPVVTINGQVKFSGYLFIPLIIQELDALLKKEV